MAKKRKNVTLENVELKPQVIGTIYKKKSNLFRVFLIFIIFGLVIYYINDVSVYINDWLGKITATSISENTEKNKTNEESSNIEEESNEVELLTFSTDLTITYEDVVFNNFTYIDGTLTFDVVNNTENTVSYSDNLIFLEIYSESNTLLDRFKIDIDSISSGNKISFSYDVSSELYYVALVQKTEEDYPVVSLEEDENGKSILTCTSDHTVIEYTFINSLLSSITDTTTYNLEEENYSTYYQMYQSNVINYNSLTGVTASFNTTDTDFTAIININLASANVSNFSNKYYFSYEEEAKVVSFEMTTYGFTCS